MVRGELRRASVQRIGEGEESLNLSPTESEASISDSEDEEFWSSDEDEEIDCSSTSEEPFTTVDDLSSEQNEEPLFGSTSEEPFTTVDDLSSEQNEEPLCDGSSVSKIFAYVLAWQPLWKSYEISVKNYFATVEPTAIQYCAS